MSIAIQRDLRSRPPFDHDVELGLLGGFNLVANGRPVPLAESSRRVVGYLALHTGPQPRVVVAGNLWPEKSEERATANLRSSLWRVRCADGVALIDVTGPTLRLSPYVHVDVEELQAAWLTIIERRSMDIATSFDRRLLFADLLPGWYDDWVLFERERLVQLQLHLLDALVEVLVRAGRYGEAIDNAMRLVAADPLRERSHLVLIAAYAAEGNLCLAQRQYNRYCDVLSSTFGCEADVTFAEAVSKFSAVWHVGQAAEQRLP